MMTRVSSSSSRGRRDGVIHIHTTKGTVVCGAARRASSPRFEIALSCPRLIISFITAWFSGDAPVSRSCHVVQCHVMSRNVMSCHVM